MYKIILRVKRVEGNCVHGHKVGDTIVINDSRLEEGSPCLTALSSMWYRIYGMARGGDFTESIPRYKGWTEDVTTIACPDDQHRVFFEIQRVRDDRSKTKTASRK